MLCAKNPCRLKSGKTNMKSGNSNILQFPSALHAYGEPSTQPKIAAVASEEDLSLSEETLCALEMAARDFNEQLADYSEMTESTTGSHSSASEKALLCLDSNSWNLI